MVLGFFRLLDPRMFFTKDKDLIALAFIFWVAILLFAFPYIAGMLGANLGIDIITPLANGMDMIHPALKYSLLGLITPIPIFPVAWLWFSFSIYRIVKPEGIKPDNGGDK